VARAIDPQKREDLLGAARAVFAEHGFVGARMADIAARAGVATGTVYLYFESKESLVAALVDDLLRRLTGTLCAVLDQPTAHAPIAETVHTALVFLSDEGDLLRLQWLELGLSALAGYHPLPGYRHLLQELATRLASRMAQGQIRRYDPAALAALLIGMVQWVAEIGVLRGDGDIAKYEATVLQLLEQALRTSGTAAERLSAVGEAEYRLLTADD
jgi:AcrR family transcriptional regulator